MPKFMALALVLSLDLEGLSLGLGLECCINYFRIPSNLIFILVVN